MRKFGCVTLGCRLNQCESDALIGQFLEQGFTLVEDGKNALDVYIINTCAVTARGEQKSRQAVSRAQREHPEALIIVTGCAIEENQEQFPRGAKVLFVDNNRKHALVAIALQALNAQHGSALETPLAAVDPDRFAYSPARSPRHTRAGLKVQDGCDNRCTYCIVPRVRGKAQSRPLADCCRAARELLALGYREIVLTGVNLQQYRDPESGAGLDALITQLLDLEGDYRLRLSSLEAEAGGMAARIARLFGHERLCSNLHLCLQSGSDRILAAMGRRYRAGDCLELCTALRGRERFFTITADIIVGFPGEDDQDFADTLALVRQASITHVHAFPFSARTGCPAGDLTPKLSKTEMRERMRELRRAADQNRAAFLQSLIGAKERVLIEKITPDGSASGYGRLYIPITLRGGRFAHNTFADCTIIGHTETGLDADPL
ncbi:MAG: tRNA (N(6)-L-threonylcarbamoyladenosine(37)-C(2))-methylthiotransferase MtaB [Spirochaetota bacterium]|nr:tRNA (N(6)-L-threonylcarbamoyladenosine(37)-C(2))-methylthiotransferase MtaB [Spirochaetota bacterium]